MPRHNGVSYYVAHVRLNHVIQVVCTWLLLAACASADLCEDVGEQVATKTKNNETTNDDHEHFDFEVHFVHGSGADG